MQSTYLFDSFDLHIFVLDSILNEKEKIDYKKSFHTELGRNLFKLLSSITHLIIVYAALVTSLFRFWLMLHFLMAFFIYSREKRSERKVEMIRTEETFADINLAKLFCFEFVDKKGFQSSVTFQRGGDFIQKWT